MKDYKNEVTFRFYTKEKSDIISFIKLIENKGYIPTKISTDNDYNYDNFETSWDELDLSEGAIISYEGSSVYSIIISLKGDVFSLNFHFDNNLGLIRELESYVFSCNQLYYAYLSSQYDIIWQDQELIIFYENNNKSLEGLKFTLDVFDKKCVDISYNYGRTVYKSGILFNAAFKSWFSQELIDEFEFQEIESIKPIVSLEKKDNLLVLQLFDNLVGDYSQYRHIQKEFLEKCNLI